LKRAIQKRIETPLGRLLLQGAVKDGHVVKIDANPTTGELIFQ
jgi:ATP-dependent Clp protease ATP-binding subunit ClpA